MAIKIIGGNKSTQAEIKNCLLFNKIVCQTENVVLIWAEENKS